MGRPEPCFGKAEADAAHTPYAAEAESRWGRTEAYRQSQRRAASYGDAEWARIKREADRNVAAFVALMARGEAATSRVAADLAEDHRQHISRWFYDCPLEMHRGLGQMYVDDPRFTATYDAEAPGLAQFIRDAIHANADTSR